MTRHPPLHPPRSAFRVHRSSFPHLLFSALLLTLTACTSSHPTPARPPDLMPAFHLNDRILFQGDSITDGNRGRNTDPNHILGHGYQALIASYYYARLPDRHLTFLNRGVSGNKVTDLQRRWQTDTIALQPTLLSILIGVNDLAASVPTETYEAQYDQLLADTVAALPNVRLVLMEPFGLPVGTKKDGWIAYHTELIRRQQVVAKLAAKYHAPVVHLQKVFEDACSRAPADYWIWDGIHPTYAGHQLLADEWIKAVKEFYPPLTSPLAPAPIPATATTAPARN